MIMWKETDIINNNINVTDNAINENDNEEKYY
jgi:hypothetical protein